MAKLPGFNLELADSPSGPLLSLGDPDNRGLSRLVNAIASGELPDLIERLRRDESVELDGARCGRPPPSLDLAEARQGFLERAGRDAMEEGGFVLVDGEPYPLFTLEDMSYELARVREEWTKLEKRAADLRSHEERVASITSAPFERESLAYVEESARIVDELDADPKTHEILESAATLSAKRRFLLVELQAHGLLDDHDVEKKLALLKEWKLPVAASWLRAAVEHLAYQRSPERAEFAPGHPLRPLMFSPISLDWFRKPQPIPPKVVVDRLRWTAWCEKETVEHFEHFGTGGEGWWIWHSGRVTHQFYWRYDNGQTPTLYKVT
jgi:hypothetical protein